MNRAFGAVALVALMGCGGAVSTESDAGGDAGDLGPPLVDTGFVSVCNAARQICRTGEVCTADQGQYRCRGLSVLPPAAMGCATVWCTGYDQCVDLRASDAHCGTCGSRCPMGRRCSAGICVTP